MVSRNDAFNKLLTEDEIKLILSKAVSGDARLKQYKIQPLSENAPKGFMGEHTALMIDYNDGGQIVLFLKTLPVDSPRFKEVATKIRAFYKEIELYNGLFSDIEKVQTKLVKPWRPKCYFTKDYETLILEDLTRLDYKMVDDYCLLDEDHLLVILKSTAHMHAGSIILQESKKVGNKAPTIADLYPHLIFETEQNNEEGHPGGIYVEVAFHSQMPLIDYLDCYTPEEKEEIRQKITPLMREVFNTVKPSNTYTNLMLHGDLWINNIMFHYDSKGRVDNAVLIDFQLARYCPPASDLMMLFLFTQRRAARQANQTKWLQYYYSILKEELQNYDIDVEKVLPWQELIDSCKYYHKHATISATFYFQYILLPECLVEELCESTESFINNLMIDRTEIVKKCFLHPKNRSKYEEVLRELIDCYIFNKE